MKVGLLDVDSHNFPNLALMKISAYHKSIGDDVEFVFPLNTYDKVYVSKVFGNEYSQMPSFAIQAKEIVFGGTGFSIKIEGEKEVYTKKEDTLPYEVEHIYPDYDLYNEYTKETAYGFLTRGCPNDCEFCIVSKKEGRASIKVADLTEFWRGQAHIKLLDPNLLACKEREDLLRQLAESKARIDFTQGLDARYITKEIAILLKSIKTDRVHFAFDFMKNEEAIIKGLRTYKEICNPREQDAIVYMLTNYNTTVQEDLYRIDLISSCGYQPDVRIYRKKSAPQVLRDLQRWCNNRILFHSCDFFDYIPRRDGKTIKQLFFGGER